MPPIPAGAASGRAWAPRCGGAWSPTCRRGRWRASRSSSAGRHATPHLPHVVEAEAVGRLALLQRLAEKLLLGPLLPRAGELVLVEDAELHFRRPFPGRGTPPAGRPSADGPRGPAPPRPPWPLGSVAR